MENVHSPEDLLHLATGVLKDAGATHRNATIVAESLVESNLRGHDSHGVRRLVPYVQFIREQRLDPAAEPTTERDRAVLAVDGHNGFGQVAARQAVQDLKTTAHEHGVAAATVRNANHVGRIGEWVEALADDDLVALAFCNAEPIVAPFGGRERRLGTNPLAWAAPRATPNPALVMDWSTAAMPEGKVAVAKARGDELPEGVVVDGSGQPSTDPQALYDGGALLPFGAHKGSGLSVMIQLVGGALAGTGVFGEQGAAANGTVLIALDIDAFTTRQAFEDQAEAFCAALAGTKPAAGFDAVLVPGEIERRTRAQRMREGVPLPAETWSELEGLKGGARA